MGRKKTGTEVYDRMLVPFERAGNSTSQHISITAYYLRLSVLFVVPAKTNSEPWLREHPADRSASVRTGVRLDFPRLDAYADWLSSINKRPVKTITRTTVRYST